MRWFKDHFLALITVVSFALLAWLRLTAKLKQSRIQQRKVEEAEDAVKRAKKTATDAKTVVDQETQSDREAAKERIDAAGCDLGDLFDELDARASKRND